MVRRFICDAPLCRRRIFAERFGDDIIAERSDRTSRWTALSITLGWRSVDDPPPGLQSG